MNVCMLQYILGWNSDRCNNLANCDEGSKKAMSLTCGQGFTESVTTMWIYTVHSCSEIHSGMSKSAKLKGATGEQHKEMEKTKVVTDWSGLMKTHDWFSAYLLMNTRQNKTTKLFKLWLGIRY